MIPLRRLLVFGVREAVAAGKISLEAPVSDAVTTEADHCFLDVAGHNSAILWQSITVGELRVSVWWNYNHANHPQANGNGNTKERFLTGLPLARRVDYPKFVGATVSGWLERKTGVHLQGVGKKGLFDTYVAKSMRSELEALPIPQVTAFASEGKFFL